MKIFCVGIGGIGLSGVSQILKNQGHDVSGSDSSVSEITLLLAEDGIKVFQGHSSDNIDESIDLVIYSEAVPEENTERMKASELGIRQINYAKALGILSEDKKTIAIAGTHGKTTVTGMLTNIFLETNLDPSIIIGSKIDVLGNKNFRYGEGEILLAEACEYRDNYLELYPDIVLINNLEPDHLDYFKTEENYFASFQKFIEKIPEDGTLVIFEEDQDKIDLTKVQAGVRIISDEDCNGELIALSVPGEHNQRNAQAAKAVAEVLHIDAEKIKEGLKKFNGTWRRFEYKGELNGAIVYDDYGHHPTEIEATIQAAREKYPDKYLTIIFQPHQYSRTNQFFDQFKDSFHEANEAWITDIYEARDSQEDLESVSAEKLANALNQKSKYFPMSQLATEMQNRSEKGKLFLVMGAGNIHSVFDKLDLKK